MGATPKQAPTPKKDEVWHSVAGTARVVINAVQGRKVFYTYISGRQPASMDHRIFCEYFTKGK